MRKRERDRMVKILQDLIEQSKKANFESGLSGAAWYFDANSEIKGYSFAYSCARAADYLGLKIRTELNKALISQGETPWTGREYLREDHKIQLSLNKKSIKLKIPAIAHLSANDADNLADWLREYAEQFREKEYENKL